MPSNTHKSAAVPFVNQKGERSMKRVKVERYVAGKKPAYAKDDDDEEEYYITDDEDDEDQGEDDEEEEEEEDDEAHRAFRSNRILDYGKHDSDDDDESSESDNRGYGKPETSGVANRMSDQLHCGHESETDDDDDDPRFRQLKQIKSKATGSQLIEMQRTQQIQSRQELKSVIIDEDDDEDEIRKRHALARSRQIEMTAERSRVSSDQVDPNDIKQEGDDDDEIQDGTNRPSKRLETDDLLKDLKLTGISRPMRAKLKTEEEEREERRRMKELIGQAKLEASFTKQTNEKIDEDIKKEIEREALAKGDIGAREMTAVNTDDEDDEIAYEEWKLREIQRVLRDRSERRLAAFAR